MYDLQKSETASLEADWRILRGTPDFFTVTKKFHDVLQGYTINPTEMKKRIYVENNKEFSSYCHIDNSFGSGDVM
ncbi:MAG: hypothetical protein ACUVTM_06565 [Candidatus Bathyarchaeia archaeon]